MRDASSGRNERRGKGRPRNSESAARSLEVVLNLVRTGQATTRQELERTSELGRAIVADRLATLGEMKLVDESALATPTGGRAPRLVQFNRDAGRILVATLDQTAIGVGVADLAGSLQLEHHEARDLSMPPENTTARLGTLFEWLLEKEARTLPVWGIGISMPGPVQTPDGGAFLSTTPALLPAWEGYPFVETLLTRFGAPVWLRSSDECMTMGEFRDGSDDEVRNMLFIKVGKRIGAGMVFDGRLHRGAEGAAGLIGQLPIEVGGRSGPLEVVAGSETIAREGLEAARSGASAMLADLLHRTGTVSEIDVGQAAQMGDTVSMEILSRCGRLIGQVVAPLANLLNPSVIVLSGSIAQTNDALLAAVREAVYGASHPLVTRNLRIRSSRMGSSAGLVGAAVVAVEGLFEPDVLREWVSSGSPLLSKELAAVLVRAKARCEASAMDPSDGSADEPPVPD